MVEYGYRYHDPEIAFRMGELYLEMGFEEKALQNFDAVLSWEGLQNTSLLRRSRSKMSEIYLGRDDFGRAFDLYRIPTEGERDGPLAFEKAYLRGSRSCAG